MFIMIMQLLQFIENHITYNEFANPWLNHGIL